MAEESKSNVITHVDLSGEDIHWDTDLSYGKYLQLERILSSQHPLSSEHDEILFIVIHQATELWMKVCLHEVGGAIAAIQRDRLRPAFKMLSRLARIQDQLKHSWDVLSTMTPFDYLKFRDKLGRSSGFQSYQYRIMEFALGNKNPAFLKVHESEPDVHKNLQAALDAPSLYDETLKLLARRGFDLPDSVLERDWSEPYKPSKEVEDVWLEIYRDAEANWDIYELAEKLVDLEHQFQTWRFAHLKTVERIIGHKRGTGGSSGLPYLTKALDLRFFPELWSVRTRL